MECSDDEFVRGSQCDEEDEEEQQRQSSQRPPFVGSALFIPLQYILFLQYENMRTFAPSHMHISCHYDIPYPPHLIQPPVCGVSTFTYAREFPVSNSQQFFNVTPPQQQQQQGTGGSGEEDYCIPKSEDRDHSSNYSIKSYKILSTVC